MPQYLLRACLSLPSDEAAAPHVAMQKTCFRLPDHICKMIQARGITSCCVPAPARTHQGRYLQILALITSHVH